MGKPRRPFGPNPPGRLAATMIKVLAAELSDQSRLSRGKRYWTDDAVIDIVVGHGAVTAEVQGSRPAPYVVTLEAVGGSGLPAKRDIWVICTCPDDAGTGSDACKHAVAALFALSDEVAIEPELVDRWRSGRQGRRQNSDVTRLSADDPDTRELESTSESEDEGPGGAVIEFRPRRDPELDQIAMLLAGPAGTPTFPDPTVVDHSGIRDAMLSDVLNDALDNLAIRWE